MNNHEITERETNEENVRKCEPYCPAEVKYGNLSLWKGGQNRFPLFKHARSIVNSAQLEQRLQKVIVFCFVPRNFLKQRNTSDLLCNTYLKLFILKCYRYSNNWFCNNSSSPKTDIVTPHFDAAPLTCPNNLSCFDSSVCSISRSDGINPATIGRV